MRVSEPRNNSTAARRAYLTCFVSVFDDGALGPTKANVSTVGL